MITGVVQSLINLQLVKKIMYIRIAKFPPLQQLSHNIFISRESMPITSLIQQVWGYAILYLHQLKLSPLRHTNSLEGGWVMAPVKINVTIVVQFSVTRDTGAYLLA